MGQIVQSGHISVGNVGDIVRGGMCAWRLPADASCASVARSLLTIATTTLGLDGDAADNAILAASELATNALNHGPRADADSQTVPPELWIWARTTPTPQLVVSVFDACRTSWPDTKPRDLLDEHGKGLSIIGMLADTWGAHPSRSFCTEGIQGKAVWSAHPLPGPWPNPRTTAPPMLAARYLASALTARGLPNITHCHGKGVSLVTVPTANNEETNVWIDPATLSYTDPTGTRHRRPIVDLHDAAETLLSQAERRLGLT
ncbi:ATP-binding protein [Actinomadura geliboluensis]|uniref:ATP-binding protein n=1 Tax=Actinomadura geliboluensis TaxID=882440 RepID=UPI00371314BE